MEELYHLHDIRNQILEGFVELFSARLLCKRHVIFVTNGLYMISIIYICEFVFFYSKMLSVIWLVKP